MWQIIVPGYEPQNFDNASDAWLEVDSWQRAGVDLIIVRRMTEKEES